MAKNRKSKGMLKAKARKTQVVYSEPQRIFKEEYISIKGKRIFASAKTKDEKDFIWKLYGKNRYVSNPNAVPIKTITHHD